MGRTWNLSHTFVFERLDKLKQIQTQFIVGGTSQCINSVGSHEARLIRNMFSQQLQGIRDLNRTAPSPLFKKFSSLNHLALDGPVYSNEKLSECPMIVDQTETKAPQQISFLASRVMRWRFNDCHEPLALLTIRLQSRIDQTSQKIVGKSAVLVFCWVVIFILVIQNCDQL